MGFVHVGPLGSLVIVIPHDHLPPFEASGATKDKGQECVNNFFKNQHFHGKFLCYINTGMWLNMKLLPVRPHRQGEESLRS